MVWIGALASDFNSIQGDKGNYSIRASSTNLGALGKSFKWGILLYLIINSYIFFQLKFIFLAF